MLRAARPRRHAHRAIRAGSVEEYLVSLDELARLRTDEGPWTPGLGEAESKAFFNMNGLLVAIRK
jgi:hypothetical protein